MNKGHITVFLALTLSLILSLFTLLIEGARINAIKMQVELVTDMGVESAFAEYHQQLLEQYDLFFIDTSYGNSQGSIVNTAEHIRNYMQYNFKPSKDLFLPLARDFLALDTDYVHIGDYTIATDEAGYAMKKQAIDYMKDKVLPEFLEEVQKDVKITKENAFDTTDVAAKEQSVQQEIESVPLPKEEVKPDEWEEMEIHNPADKVNSSRKSGLLSLVVDNRSEISSRSVNLGNLVSHRRLKTGTVHYEKDENESGAVEELIFGEYLLEKCGNYTNNVDKNYLKYQIEYILAGKNNDTENLKSVVKKLIAFREASNLLYLLQDEIKVAEADALAAGLSVVVAVPELQPLIKYSILLAWSFAESVNDVKMLLNKGKVPLIKQSRDWKLSLEQMLFYEDNLSAGDGSNEKDGLSYEMYLRIFLNLMNREDKVFRFMDIVEMDIRGTKGNIEFCLDNCTDYLEAQMQVSSRYGYNYVKKRDFHY